MLCKGRVLVAVAALALVACDNKKSGEPPPPSGGLPPLDEKVANMPIGDKPVHEPTGGAPSNPHGGGLPPGHPTVGGGAGGGGGMEGQATPGDIPFDPKSVVSGTIQVSDKLKAKVAEGDAIYVVARSADQPGPPLAVKKLIAGKFPLAFELDGRDAMMAGTKMAGKITINARVDKDGDAMTKNPGDVFGTKTVELPAQKVVVTLDSQL
jgi:hypothetical protein